MDFLRKITRWISAFGRWLMQARRVWEPVVVAVGILVAASLLPARLEDRLRYGGLVLELLGIAAVVLGIRSKRRLFNRPSLWEHVRAWLNRWPRLGVSQRAILAADTASLTLSGSGRLSTWHSAGPNAGLEARLAAAEANLITLRTDLGEAAEEVRAQARQRAEAVSAEREERETAVKDVRTKLEALGAEGLHVEMAGVFWLVLGVLLDTIPGEAACAINWMLRWVR